MATRPTARGIGCLVVALVLLGTAVVGLFAALRDRGLAAPVPGQQRCVATADNRSVVLDLEQARLTSIIVGLSVRRGLAPRAASIAMATVYQETGIRNLDHGDRDSVGLFQQRPSQGWGTVERLQDPYYATRKFYEALVKVDGWETGDINDVAQRVQRSGHPEAYRDHEADGRVLASVFTGSSPGGLTCLERADRAGDVDGLVNALEKSLGPVDHDVQGVTVTVAAGRERLAWAYAHSAVANAAHYGVTTVTIGDQTWTTDGVSLPTWTDAAEPLAADRLTITVRAAG
jgi:hypothetical protein